MNEEYMPFEAEDKEVAPDQTEEISQSAAPQPVEEAASPVIPQPAEEAASPVAPEPVQAAPVRPNSIPPQYFQPAPPIYGQQVYGYPPVQQPMRQVPPMQPRPVMPPQAAMPPRYTASQPVPPKKKAQKKKRPGLRLALVALSCALAGSLCGGAIVGLVMRSNQPEPIVSYREPIATDNSSHPAISSVANPDGTMSPAQVYQANVAAVVGIANESTTYNVFGQSSTSASSGSGFIISSDGEILTNYHVVEGAQTLTVSLHDGSQFSARVLGYEAESDVALIKIDATGLPTVTLGDSDQLYVGDEVAAIGNPLGELTYSLTVGYISSMDRDINTDGTPINMMQIDAAINPGNSGGPLFDMYGNVIGINTAKYSGTVGTGGATIEGIGFAIPINDVLYILDDLRENGTVPNRAYIGVTVTTVGESTAMGTPAGVQINSVTPGSSGDKAGLRTNDIITAVDDTPILTVNDLSKALKHMRAGDSAVLTIFRGGKALTVNVVFDAKPDSQEASVEPTVSTEPNEGNGFDFFDPWSFLP